MWISIFIFRLSSFTIETHTRKSSKVNGSYKLHKCFVVDIVWYRGRQDRMRKSFIECTIQRKWELKQEGCKLTNDKTQYELFMRRRKAYIREREKGNCLIFLNFFGISSLFSLSPDARTIAWMGEGSDLLSNVFMIRHIKKISWHNNLFKSFLSHSRENWSYI